MRLWLAFLASLLFAVPPPAHAQDMADVALVLLADGSGSIDPEEFRMQREGYADALESPEVLNAIRGNAHGRILVAYVEWGAPQSQDIVVDWSVIDGEGSARAVGSVLRTAPRRSWGHNSISNAIGVAMALFGRAPATPERRVIDVSGDGPNIGGRSIHEARNEAVAAGVTINALAIRPEGSSVVRLGMPLEDYYRQNVIGGMGAFVEIARDRASLAEALRRKLVLEIASTGQGVRHAEAR